MTLNKDGSMVYDTDESQGDFSATIEAIIDKKMKGVYWIVGSVMIVMLVIFVTIALPIQTQLIEVIKVQQTKAFKTEVEQVTKDTKSIYLEKEDYYLIEEDAHRVLKEIVRNPDQADYLMTVINDNIKEQLGFKRTTRGGEK